MRSVLDRLGGRLCNYGLSVADEDFRVTRGYWARQDVVRWEGSFRMAGARMDSPPIEIDSYDTAGKCARYGLWLTDGGVAYGQYEAVAKVPGMTPPAGIVEAEEFKRRHKVA